LNFDLRNDSSLMGPASSLQAQARKTLPSRQVSRRVLKQLAQNGLDKKFPRHLRRKWASLMVKVGQLTPNSPDTQIDLVNREVERLEREIEKHEASG
jgi:hypothetical protein